MQVVTPILFDHDLFVGDITHIYNYRSPIPIIDMGNVVNDDTQVATMP